MDLMLALGECALISMRQPCMYMYVSHLRTHVCEAGLQICTYLYIVYTCTCSCICYCAILTAIESVLLHCQKVSDYNMH